ncbi:MAG: YciI family protein [Phenylobacterium sp.]|uniref:YciI family protein n=1 Tax=Phenylobacterium sp. TaxID=1871053 RepID=UPI003919D133
MPAFVLYCIDKPDSLSLRLANREAHLAYVGAAAAKVPFAGPMLDDAGEMAGSLIVLEADSLDEAKAFSADDPYVKAGLFERVEIRPFRLSLQRR